MQKIQITHPSQTIEGEITLPGSKSIANRSLIIRALCEEDFEIKNLSSAKDTQTLIELLNSKE
ncbi:MAG: 3-phosphoshikimate 1-carboxyvinyltransferase, partial [Saprospiraceae bacterium]